MLPRRRFIKFLCCIWLISSALPSIATESLINPFKGEDVFDRILQKANEGHWKKLPIGDLMGKIAMELGGTPYVANTLELSPDTEACSVNLKGLDCVTFFESTLGFARMLKRGGRTPEDLLREVSFTRYRGGTVGDYTTRLHYTIDWFFDNEKKHVVKNLSNLPGSETFHKTIDFMSQHSESSIQLKAHPELIARIKQTEDEMSKRKMKFVPLDKLSKAEPMLQTGDIVGIVTDTPGLDISHTGLVVRTADGVVHFMDASSRKGVMQVTLEQGPLSQTLARNKHAIGAMFARPLEPR
jgi:hypothetical protein